MEHNRKSDLTSFAIKLPTLPAVQYCTSTYQAYLHCHKLITKRMSSFVRGDSFD